MAKIVKGSSFRGVVRYILDENKQTNLLASDGVRLKSIETIIDGFNSQQKLNTRVNKPVGHISLDFSAQDKDKLSDEFMTKIAHEYMELMGIINTQYIIGRHHDKEHPHLHIAFNRIDNYGKTISDGNDRRRSEKICKELTTKYGLYFAKGKENVKTYRLKEPDKTKYEIYDALKIAVPKCKNWKELCKLLENGGIAVDFKMRSGTNEPQGVNFIKNGYRFSGSKVDVQFSYSKINYSLDRNYREENIPMQQKDSIKQEQTNCVGNSVSDILNAVEENLFQPAFNDAPAVDTEEARFQRKLRKKKRTGLR